MRLTLAVLAVIGLAGASTAQEPTVQGGPIYEGFVDDAGEFQLRLKQRTANDRLEQTLEKSVPKNFESYATVGKDGQLLGIEVVPGGFEAAGKVLGAAPEGASVIKFGSATSSGASNIADYLFPSSEELTEKAKKLVREMTKGALEEGCGNPLRGKEFAASAGLSFGVGVSGNFQFSQTWDVEDVCARLQQ